MTNEQPEQITDAEMQDAPDWAWNLASAIVLGNQGCGNAAVLIQRAIAEREAELVGAISAYHRLLFPISMSLAEREMIDEPLSDDAVLFSFMGSGASDHTTVGEFRKADALASAALKSREAGHG